MFVGHYAVGLAAKRFAPRTSLGTLIAAALLADLLVWAFVIAGLEHVGIKPGITATNALDLYDYPISHSLLLDAVWGALFGAGYYLIRKSWRASVIIFVVVLSHWVLDFIAHRPDMPLAPGLHHYYGLGLYNSRIGMIVVEGLIWLAGIAVYLRATRSAKRLGAFVFWLGITVLTWIWLVSLKGQPPPGTIAQAAISGLIFMCITVAWAYGVDHLRCASAVSVPTPSQETRKSGAPE